MKIGELRSGMRRVDVEAEIIEIPLRRLVNTRWGGQSYVSNVRISDETGTIRLKNLHYFPCNCPVCRKVSPSDLKKMDLNERRLFLLKHNLYACKLEIERIKQSIKVWC